MKKRLIPMFADSGTAKQKPMYELMGSKAQSHTMIDEAIALFPGAKNLGIKVIAEENFCEAFIDNMHARVPVRDESPAKSAKFAVYTLLSSFFKIQKAWGAMTGVKPLKKYSELIAKGMSSESVKLFFENCYGTSLEKIELLSETYRFQQNVIEQITGGCIYISVPMCPQKCSYCSFPSKITKLGDANCAIYANSLLYEMEAIEPVLKEANISFQSIYIGGGTPAILAESQTAAIIKASRRLAPDAVEVTFEAGRSDCISQSKLELLKRLGVTRISLNPQSFNESTMRSLGRDIPNDMFYSAYEYAKSLSFDINCDLIFGLPGENYSDCFSSLNELIKLSPENITIHSLCKKRTAEMDSNETVRDNFDAAWAQDEARSILSNEGYKPYYLYKQKNAVSSAENVGYAREGKACLYNIAMMGEFSDIVGFGANASSLFFDNEGSRAVRIYNTKDFILYNKDLAVRTDKKAKRILGIKKRFLPLDL